MELEFLASRCRHEPGTAAYSFALSENTEPPFIVIDWFPAVEEILDDVRRRVPAECISLKFHYMLAETVVTAAKHFAQHRVVLSGGCFQNRMLTERTLDRLEEEGFHPYWHQRVPPNDGGIALGQIYAASRLQRKKT
jgi:hydrogenase maturation protein HypF